MAENVLKLSIRVAGSPFEHSLFNAYRDELRREFTFTSSLREKVLYIKVAQALKNIFNSTVKACSDFPGEEIHENYSFQFIHSIIAVIVSQKQI